MSESAGANKTLLEAIKEVPEVKFTVTPVSETSTLNGDVVHDGNSDIENGISGQRHHEAVSLRVPDLSGLAGESDSQYGDTLSQTSITKLLARKFKTYRAVKYDTRSENGEVGERTSFALSRSTSRQGSSHNLNSKYESQDYDQCENALFMKEQESQKSLKIHRKWLARWFVMLLIGIGTALVAVLIEICISYACKYKFMALKSLTDSCESGACLVLPLLVWVLINAFLIFLGSTLVTLVEPQAAGSGVPQIKCYLNGVKIPGLLSMKALVAKTVGVVLSVSGGLACGKEGPMIHSGAIVAAGISQGRSKLFNYDFKIFEYLRSDTEKRDFVSGGAAAGVSSAFGAPVGGVLFSLEEGASFWNQALTWRIVFASMIATFLVNILLSAVHGHPADLSNPGLITFGQFTHITYQYVELPIFVVMAVFGGLSGALFNLINGKLIIFRKKYITRTVTKVAEAVLVAVMSAVMSFLLIFLVNDCTSVATGHDRGQDVQLECPEGQRNILSSLFFQTPESAIVAVLHDEKEAYSMLSLSLFVILYYFLACWTCGLSVSSGIFIPSLLIGSSWGRLVGICVTKLFPNMDQSNIGKYALVGAACQLGGVVRMTVSLTVILLECTGNITFGLPIVMTLIIAKWVGDFFTEGLYDLHIHMMGIPLLPWEPPEMSYDITAKQTMSRPVHYLNTIETVRSITDMLEESPHSGFPVVIQPAILTIPKQHELAPYGRCTGLILRSQLLLLLKYKVFNKETDGKQAIKLEDFRDAYPRHISVLDVKLTEAEKGCRLDLRPYMNPSPYTVPENCSLPRMFRLFRGLGLRHLLVVNESNEVVGMVTRKDLAKYRMKASGVSLEVQELNIQNDYS